MKAKIVAALLMLSGCADLPWDPEGTMERIQESKVLRVGIISSGNGAPDVPQRRFLSSVASETGSRPHLVTGPAELLLPKLEEGELDIVVGHFAADTPWSKRVTFMPTPGQRGGDDGEPTSAAVIRNGENGWITLVHKHAPILKGASR